MGLLNEKLHVWCFNLLLEQIYYFDLKVALVPKTEKVKLWKNDWALAIIIIINESADYFLD